MSIHNLTLETLPEIDNGQVAKQFNKLIQDAINDCRSRPGDSSARKAVITMIAKPVSNPDCGGCDEVEVEFEMAIKTPSRHTKIYPMGVKANGSAYFNSESTGSIKQMTLDETNGRQLPDDEE